MPAATSQADSLLGMTDRPCPHAHCLYFLADSFTGHRELAVLPPLLSASSFDVTVGTTPRPSTGAVSLFLTGSGVLQA